MTDISRLENKIGYSFVDREILRTALTHSSYAREARCPTEDNQRLEFWGDAFFDAIIGEKLYRIFPHEEEGFLSRIRATLVCEQTLAQVALKLELGRYILLGHGEEKTGGRSRISILADCMEAIMGAIYLDGGYEAVSETVLKLFEEPLEETAQGKFIITDYKTHLQEVLQAKGITDIKYTTIEESGPPHDKIFTVRVNAGGEVLGEGSGKTKKQAEQNAAKKALSEKYNAI